MYRGLINKARMRRMYNHGLRKFKPLEKNPSETKDIVKSKLIDNKVEKKKIKSINFNNSDHLNKQFHFLLEEENRRSRNRNDLPPFLL